MVAGGTSAFHMIPTMDDIKPNQHVDVWWNGEARYYPGTVTSVNADGTLEVTYSARPGSHSHTRYG